MNLLSLKEQNHSVKYVWHLNGALWNIYTGPNLGGKSKIEACLRKAVHYNGEVII